MLFIFFRCKCSDCNDPGQGGQEGGRGVGVGGGNGEGEMGRGEMGRVRWGGRQRGR